jgi:hypothetical protein
MDVCLTCKNNGKRVGGGKSQVTRFSFTNTHTQTDPFRAESKRVNPTKVDIRVDFIRRKGKFYYANTQTNKQTKKKETKGGWIE